ncbi:MAG: tetratricopeptide repeat protein [Gemmatirosa sp.]|nr:tetratricopeptide repeat protein [Gemmatirosa sp.]
MSTLAKLSKQAVQLEHDRQYDKALALFSRLFDEAATAEEEVDVALFNRAGDVAMRLGDTAAAVRYYERAVDAYAAGGLLNNAIAVCNKMLRQAPDHAATHYTLGVLHAKQGFRGDAKHHFVEYADRMHRAGRDDESLRALGEFAALCPVGDDARAALSLHLAKGNRGAEVAARLQAMLGAPGSAPSTPVAAVPPTSAAPSAGSTAAPADDRARSLVFLDVSVDGLEPTPAPTAAPLLGLEPTAFAEAPMEPALDIVIDTPATPDEPFAPTLELPLDTSLDISFDAPLDVSFDAPLDVSFDAPLDVDFGGWQPADAAAQPLDLDLTYVADDAHEPALPATASGPRWTSSLPGELPMLSLAGWIGSASAVGVMEPVVAAPIDGGFAVDDEPAADASPELHFLVAEPEVVEAIASEPAAIEAPRAAASPASDAEFVDLGAWLRDSEPAPSTRMTTDDVEPSGDESADFERMLGVFRAGVARSVEVEDYASHYDLGVAFREMGLVEDAIAEFQKAARAPEGGLRAREALGQCFLDRGSPALAVATLQRALDDRAVPSDDAALVGVLYLLGLAHAQLGDTEPARGCFERVVAADIQFRDAAARLSQLSALRP